MSASVQQPIADLRTRRHSRTITWIELFGAWGLIEATIWTSGETQHWLFWIAAAFVILSTIAHRPTLDRLGIGVRGLVSSLWVIPAAALLAGLAVFAAWRLGTLHPLFGVIGEARHSFAYVVWAIFQQFLLQSYFFLRLEELLHSGKKAVVVSATIFTLAHIPNPVLMAVCLPAGLISCEIFRRDRNIYALGVAHAILGLTIAVTVPDNVQRHMRVGIGYFHYQESGHRVIGPENRAIG